MRGRLPPPKGYVVGIPDIAKNAGTVPQNVHKWISRYPDFPEPFDELLAGKLKTKKLYWWPDVDEWLIANGKYSDSDAESTAEDVYLYTERFPIRRR